jgi:hypothetical protein
LTFNVWGYKTLIKCLLIIREKKMAKFEWFRRESGEIMAAIVLLYIVLSIYVFQLSFKLILMGVKGEFAITAGFKGLKLYLTSSSLGLGIAAIMSVILIYSLPRVLHPRK